MRYLLPIFLLALLIPYGLHRLWQQSIPSPTNLSQQPEKEVISFKQIVFNTDNYKYDYFTITPKNKFDMYNNVIEKKRSQELIDQNKCQMLTNAGFYTKEFTNIGLLIIDGETISDYQQNQLFNGIVYASSSGELQIRKVDVEDSFENGFQTGPLLFENSKPLILSLKNDEPERRMVAINTTNNETIFMTIIGSDGKFEGPRLEDLPKVLESIGKAESFTIQNAINLDGGSASVFYNQKNYLRELKTAGTFLCFN